MQRQQNHRRAIRASLLCRYCQTMSSSIREGLPDEIISQLLGSFADGKSMSTFYMALQSNRSLRQDGSAFDIIRNALVHRLKSLAADKRLKPSRCEEMRDCIDIFREEIRTANVDTELGRLVDDMKRISNLNKKTMTIISEWCAIVEYFDISLCLDEYVVWVGEIETRFGRMSSVCARTPFWSITNFQYMHQQLELGCEALVPPNPTSSFGHLLDQPYGSLAALTEVDVEVMQRLRVSMSLDEESNRFALVPNQFEYEDSTIAFTPTPNDQAGREMLQYERHLQCLWDQQDEIDFDESLSNFGEDCLRILQRLQSAFHLHTKEMEVIGSHRNEAASQVWREFIGSDLSSFEDDALV